jgi:hypothetical protein
VVRHFGGELRHEPPRNDLYIRATPIGNLWPIEFAAPTSANSVAFRAGSMVDRVPIDKFGRVRENMTQGHVRPPLIDEQ